MSSKSCDFVSGSSANPFSEEVEDDDVELKYLPSQDADLAIKSESHDYDPDENNAIDADPFLNHLRLQLTPYDDNEDEDADWKPESRRRSPTKAKRKTKRSKPLIEKKMKAASEKVKNLNSSRKKGRKPKTKSEVTGLCHDESDELRERRNTRAARVRKQNTTKMFEEKEETTMLKPSSKSGKKPRGKRKPVVDVTEEDAAVSESDKKTPSKKRPSRVKRKEVVQLSVSAEEDMHSNMKPKKKRGSGSRTKVTEMTPEEREARKKQWREEARLRRQQKRLQMTPEEREAYLAKERDRTRAKRAEKKADPVVLEELHRKDRERKIMKRAMRTPEQRAEDNQRQTLRRLMKKVSMTDEEKEQLKQAACLKKISKLAEKTEEEIDADARARRERKRFYWATLSEEKKKRIGEKQRERRIAKLLEQGITPAGKRGRRMPPNETEEERIARRKRLRAESQRRTMLKRRIAVEKLLESGVPPDKLFNLEKRKRTLVQDRVKRAKKRLRKKLESSGVPLEKIQEELAVVEKTYLETEARDVKPYQPKRESVASLLDPVEYQKLKDEVENNPHPQSKYAKLAANPSLILVGDVNPFSVSPPKQRSLSPKKRTTSPPKKIMEMIIDPPEPVTVPLPSPTEASPTCSYVSVSGTPVVLTPAPTFQYHYQTSAYPEQNIVTYQHTEIPPQQTIMLQQVIDSVTYQDVNTTTTTSDLNTSGFNMFVQFHHQQPTYDTSSYHNNSNSIADDNPYTPPHSQQHDTLDDHSIPSQTPTPAPVVTDITTTTITTVQIPSPTSSPAPPPPKKRGKPPERGVPRGPNKRTDLSSAVPCETCGLFYKKRYMFDHKQRFHNPHFQSSTCLLCGETFSRARAFVKHYHVVHKGAARGPNRGANNSTSKKPKNPDTAEDSHDTTSDAVQCDICENFYKPHYLRIHKMSVHNPHFKDGKCLLCGEMFKQAKHFLPHYNKMHREKVERIPPADVEKTRMCEICGWSFKTNSELQRHHREKHTNCPKQMVQCPYCPGEKLLAKNGLRNHYMYVHPEHFAKNNPKCGRCDKQFDKDSDLIDHYKVDHGGAHFPCQFCNSVSYTKIGLFYHYVKCIRATKTKVYELMEEEGPDAFFLARAKIPCEFCKHKMVISSLSRHYYEIHGVKNDKQFECWRCDKKFIRRDRWAFHMIDYHGIEWGPELVEQLSKLWADSREELQVENQLGMNKHTARYFERVKNWPKGKRLPQKKYKTKRTEEIHKKLLPKVSVVHIEAEDNLSSDISNDDGVSGEGKRRSARRCVRISNSKRLKGKKKNYVKEVDEAGNAKVERSKRLMSEVIPNDISRRDADELSDEVDVKPF